MGAVLEFIKSDQALTILGLPGFALLLAFLFYQTLVKSKIVSPIGQNQSFAILALIIVYFLVVTVLVILLYQPPRADRDPPGRSPEAASPQVAAPAAETLRSKVNAFLERVTLATPLATFDSTLGPAAADVAEESDRKVRVRRYLGLEDGVFVTAAYEGGTVRGIAAVDEDSRLAIPTMSMGDGETGKEYRSLADFTLQTLADNCPDGNFVTPYAGKNGIYAVSPCYFGRPGGYNNYAFMFVSRQERDCWPQEHDGKAVGVTLKLMTDCDPAKARPIGFALASEASDLDPAMLPAFRVLIGDPD